ncbi:hypothetical protein F4778DRAFT_750532 [Xylariomycetidae sp. FL2044]|nr:hypothetical protein F4778DRAFT_750532 [Xylariomycetidae sp. FL2044]
MTVEGRERWIPSYVDERARLYEKLTRAQAHKPSSPSAISSIRKLFQLSLRFFGVLHSDIVSPVTGLVYAMEDDDNVIKHGIDVINLRYSAKFAEALSKVIIHVAWERSVEILTAALTWASICAHDDRRRWSPQGRDPFLRAFRRCEEADPRTKKSQLLERVVDLMREEGEFKFGTWQIFYAIADATGDCDADPFEDEDVEDRWGFNVRTLKTTHLNSILKALDNCLIYGFPKYPPHQLQYETVIAKRPGGKQNDLTYPSVAGSGERIDQVMLRAQTRALKIQVTDFVAYVVRKGLVTTALNLPQSAASHPAPGPSNPAGEVAPQTQPVPAPSLSSTRLTSAQDSADGFSSDSDDYKYELLTAKNNPYQ